MPQFSHSDPPPAYEMGALGQNNEPRSVPDPAVCSPNRSNEAPAIPSEPPPAYEPDPQGQNVEPNSVPNPAVCLRSRINEAAAILSEPPPAYKEHAPRQYAFYGRARQASFLELTSRSPGSPTSSQERTILPRAGRYGRQNQNQNRHGSRRYRSQRAAELTVQQTAAAIEAERAFRAQQRRNATTVPNTPYGLYSRYHPQNAYGSARRPTPYPHVRETAAPVTESQDAEAQGQGTRQGRRRRDRRYCMNCVCVISPIVFLVGLIVMIGVLLYYAAEKGDKSSKDNS